MKIVLIILVIVIVAVITIFFLKHRQGTKFSEEQYEEYYKAKETAIESILGPMHDIVGHAIIPFQVGGTVDMYYFLNALPGTAFVTMELIEPDGSGPKPNKIGTYELIAFTKHKYTKRDNSVTENTSLDGKDN